MTGLDYVKHRLLQDYGYERSNIIIKHLTRIMTELTTPDDIEDELSSSDLQILLNDSVYPFLACYQAMQDVGVDIHIADRYVRKISEELPGKLRNNNTSDSLIDNHTANRVEEERQSYSRNQDTVEKRQ